jgi:hypothetical protein
MRLILEDGTVYEGVSFGADIDSTGEVVFSTGMTGYVESLTDPSFAGQILVCTYPLIGNYGVPDESRFESERIHISGLIVSEYSASYSHHEAERSLGAWLGQSDVPALSGIDTRALTKKLRERGVMLGQIVRGEPREFIDPNRENLVAKVSPRDVREYGSGPLRIIAVDCGMKENIVRSLARAETTVTRVPWNYDFTQDQYDALVLSTDLAIRKCATRQFTTYAGPCATESLSLACASATNSLRSRPVLPLTSSSMVIAARINRVWRPIPVVAISHRRITASPSTHPPYPPAGRCGLPMRTMARSRAYATCPARGPRYNFTPKPPPVLQIRVGYSTNSSPTSLHTSARDHEHDYRHL